MHADTASRPAGVITVEVIEARLPRRLSVTKKEKPLNPYAAIVVGHSHVAIRCRNRQHSTGRTACKGARCSGSNTVCAHGCAVCRLSHR